MAAKVQQIADDEALARALGTADFAQSVGERVKRKRGHTAPAAVSKRQKVETEGKHTEIDDALERGHVAAAELLAALPTRYRSPAEFKARILTPSFETDMLFAAATLQKLQQDLKILPVRCFQTGTVKRIIKVLQLARAATDEDGPWLTPAQFRQHDYDGPVFLRDQQPMPLWTVEQALSEFYDDNAGIDVQDGSRPDAAASTIDVKIREVKARLRDNAATLYPWNCLELAAPVEDGTRPLVLNDAEFRLLTKIKIPKQDDNIANARVCRRALFPGYKEAEKWMLLAQAGALTAPHQDSHGYNTYITCNDGLIGYGWLHKPTKEQRQRWISNALTFTNGDWRYRVLRPGDTVYFPSGTVHFVFRHSELGNTFAFGGHILRCSKIVDWIKAIKDEQSSKCQITNEDLTFSAFIFIDQVTKFVRQAREQGDIARWGGIEAIEEFLRLQDSMINKKSAAVSQSSKAELSDQMT